MVQELSPILTDSVPKALVLIVGTSAMAWGQQGLRGRMACTHAWFDAR